MKIGFIGLGSMGAPMARRLARLGFSVTACDAFPAMLDGFDEPGTERTLDPIVAAQGAEIVGVCVRTDDQVVDITRDGRLFAAMAEGGVFVLHSTVAPDLARHLEAQAAPHGVAVVDAGVSGGGPAAIEGKLSMFVGGSDAAVAKACPYLEAMGSIAHLGPVGRGLEGKLLNNLVSVANYGMSAAILDLGAQLNFDRDQLRDALMAGSAQGFALKAVPGLLRPSGVGAPSRLDSLHDLLQKDVEHAKVLAPADDPAMAALQASCEAMLARIRRAAAEEDAAKAGE